MSIPKYTEKKRRDSVRLALESGSIAQTARDLGLNENTLREWVKQYRKTEVPVVVPLSAAVPELDHSISIELLEGIRAQRLAVSETALAEVKDIDSTLHYLKK